MKAHDKLKTQQAIAEADALAALRELRRLKPDSPIVRLFERYARQRFSKPQQLEIPFK